MDAVWRGPPDALGGRTLDPLATHRAPACDPPDPSATAAMITTAPAKELVLSEPPKPVETAAEQRTETAMRSCAHWNGLLAWAREERGPQFDSSTNLFMVDKNSYEGTAYVEAVPCVAAALGGSDRVQQDGRPARARAILARAIDARSTARRPAHSPRRRLRPRLQFGRG